MFLPAWSAELNSSEVLRTFVDYSQPDKSHLPPFPILIASHILSPSLAVCLCLLWHLALSPSFHSFWKFWLVHCLKYRGEKSNFQGIVLKISWWAFRQLNLIVHQAQALQEWEWSLRTDSSGLTSCWTAASQKIKGNRVGCYLACLILWCLQTSDPNTLSADSGPVFVPCFGRTGRIL